MKIRLHSALGLLLVMLCSGCVIYLDRPEAILLRGRVVWDEDGTSVAGAQVQTMSNRAYLPTPGMAPILAGVATADAQGRFEFRVKNKWPAEIFAYDEANSAVGTTSVSRDAAEHITIRLKQRQKQSPGSQQSSASTPR